MRYLVVTHLDFSGARSSDQALAERELATRGLLRCLVDSRNEAHTLPAGTFAGVFDRAAARDLRGRLPEEVRALLGPCARIRVSIGSHAHAA
jgi:hypothetical protein